MYPLSWFNIEEWVGNFTVDATNVADIVNDHNVVYGLKLPVGYYSSPTKLTEKITKTSLVSMLYDLNECINVTFDVVTGKFTMRLLEGVSVQFSKSLLQIVHIREYHGDYVCERYETLIYTPVRRTHILDIKIDITDDTGRRIPFQAGKPIVNKRHFVEEGRQLLNKRLKPNKTAPTIKKRTSRRKNVGRKRHRDIFSQSCLSYRYAISIYLSNHPYRLE